MKPIDANFIQSVKWNLQSLDFAITASIGLILIASLFICVYYLKLNLWEILGDKPRSIGGFVAKMVVRSESNYSRNYTIGKYNDNSKKVKQYKFLNELIIDLGLKDNGATPYSFLFMVMAFSVLASLLLTQILFGSTMLGFILLPIVFTFLMCVAYTKANMAHESRIEAVIEAENIISNNIKRGVVPAIRDNINVIPVTVRQPYREFIKNVEYRNMHISVALQILKGSLGVVSEDFIAKCLVYEEEESYGMDGMFQDVVEINNTKTKLRTIRKHKFETVVMMFISGASMIAIFMIGFIALYEQLQIFYFTKVPGQILLSLDLLIFVSEFVFITYLRAQDV